MSPTLLHRQRQGVQDMCWDWFPRLEKSPADLVRPKPAGTLPFFDCGPRASLRAEPALHQSTSPSPFSPAGCSSTWTTRPHPYTRWGAASLSRSSSPAAVCPRGDIYTPSAAPSDDLCRLTEVFTQFPHASLKGDARAETTLRSCGSRCRCGDCIKCRTLQTLAISHFLSPSGGKAGLSMADICSCVPI